MLKTLATFATASVALVPLLATPSQAEPPRPGSDPLEWCLLSGGQEIPQPPGSSIQACCTADGCVICAADWSDCVFDPAYNVRPGGSQQTFDGPDTLAPPAGQSQTGPRATGPVSTLLQLAH